MPLIRSLIVVLVFAVALPGAGSSQTEDATQDVQGWSLLEDLRNRLTRGSPHVAEFSQTFTPAGFSGGDTEIGTLSLSLPRCVRWDYGEPFPKIYLLCGGIAHAWNPGEASGRRYEIAADEQEGLDLMRLDVEELRSRYRARTSLDGDRLLVDLDPRESSKLIESATLTLTVDGQRLTAIAFEDHEGNRTVFELSPFGPGGSESDFSPPTGIEWLEN